jgi:hypothetical protein
MDDPLKIHFRMQQTQAYAKREKQKTQLKKRMEKLIRKHHKTLVVSPNTNTSKYNTNTYSNPPTSIVGNQITEKRVKLNESNHSIKSGFSINDGKDNLTPVS